jgi:hypothetical protein
MKQINVMNREIKRMVIYAKDIEYITGRTDRSARKVMATIRKRLGKEKHQYVSVGEFCGYMGLPEEEVIKHLVSQVGM